MKKYLQLLSVLTVLSLASCGGGGGGGGSSSFNGGTGETTKTLTYTVATTKALTTNTTPLFYSGKPVLVCNNGTTVFYPSTNTGSSVSFSGSSFNDCVLSLTAGDGTVLLTTNEAVSGTGTVEVDDQLNVVSATGVQENPVEDADGDHVADHCEGKELHDGYLISKPLYDKTVILVFEGDNIPNNALTDYLKANYNDLVSGLQSSPDEKVKFLVIWDGGLKNGTGSDVFILDPESGKTFQTLDSDIEQIENGAPVYNFTQDGILYWFAQSDNLSVHLKDLILAAARIAPAKSYDLIVSDHGDGWVSLPTPAVRSVLYEWYDDGQQSGSVWLGTKQFAEVLKDLKDKGISFDLLGFDECLMGEFSSLSLLAPYSKVLIASPEFEPGQGWGDVWKNLPSWYAQGLDDFSIAKNVVDGYVNYYAQNPPNSPLASPETIGLTAVKSSAIETLKDAFEQFAGSLKTTAENERDNGQMYKVFYSHFSNNDLSTYNEVFWNLQSPDYLGNDTTAENLENTANQYFGYYGGSQGYDTLGYDLVGAVAKIGYTARLVELGYTNFNGGIYYTPFDSQNALTPSFAPDTVQNALNFLNAYNQVKDNGELYTKYLTLNMDGTVDKNVTGSGISLVYPYTSPDYASVPKLELCDYQNYVDSYKDVLPNYTGFVETVFGELWKAVNDAGLYGNDTGQFTCNTEIGSAVWH